MEQVFKPTQPAALPYRGAPLTLCDIIMKQVQFEDRGIEGFVRDMSQYTPANKTKEAVINKKKSALNRNWGLGNIYRKLAL